VRTVRCLVSAKCFSFTEYNLFRGALLQKRPRVQKCLSVCIIVCVDRTMPCLREVFLFCRINLFRRALFQKRPIILRSLLIVSLNVCAKCVPQKSCMIRDSFAESDMSVQRAAWHMGLETHTHTHIHTHTYSKTAPCVKKKFFCRQSPRGHTHTHIYTHTYTHMHTHTHTHNKTARCVEKILFAHSL